ncbi:MAG TPA: SDR family oxidoreductase [Flavisolibacter sp.]
MPTALILGASSDIGFAIAKKFASEKYDIQLAGRNTAQLESFRSDIAIRYQVQCSIHAFDALDFSSHHNFYHQLPVAPNVVCYVAGYMTENTKALEDFNEALKTINTNYTGAVSILNVVARDFEKKQEGTIVGISSVAGNRGRQSNYIYGSAKAAFTAYLSGLRNHLYHHKVHVLTVLPGFVYTKMTEHLNLPGLLTAQPEDVGSTVYKSVRKKKDIVYVKWFWRWIMMIIGAVPKFIFKKKKL